MSTPADRKYTETHEWLRDDGEVVTLGITQHAVDELTDITYVEMRAKGTAIKSGDTVGEVESVKATSDIYSPVGGEIVEVNAKLADDPSLLNSDPYGDGWLVRIKPSDKAPMNNLMDSATYDKNS
ncbi:MAG: glycine cleavage system protein GcvH [Phycisphaerales bacterium]